MAACSVIIRRGLQKLGIVAPGESPQASEAADAMIALQGMFDGWASGGMFGRLSAFVDGVPDPSVIEYVEPYPGAPLELPIRIRNADGDIVPPADMSMVDYIDEETNLRQSFLYDTRQGRWQRFDNLVLTDECPLSRRSVEGMAAVFAMFVADEYGVTAGPGTRAQAAVFKFGMSARYGETRRTGTAEYF